MNSSRAYDNNIKSQTSTIPQSTFNLTNRSVKHSKLDLANKQLNASVDNLNQEQILMNNNIDDQQQQLIHAPHPQPNLSSSINKMSPTTTQSVSNSTTSNVRQGNHQRVMIELGEGRGQLVSSSHHTHHLSLSETRSLKSFKSLQDQRLQRQLNRKNETSNQGSNSSQTRQRSNVREMLQTQEEKKLFESKFKGSLDKLDEFERQWSDFKVNQPPQTTSQSQSRLYSDLEVNTTRQDQSSNKLNQSFDNNASFSNTNNSQSLGQRITGNYQTQIQPPVKKESNRDMRMKPNIELKNQLDQINESPRESILQSPSSNYNDKLRSLYQPPTSKTAFQSVQRQQQITQDKQQNQNSNKECKTLKIDLNEERTALQQQNQLKQVSSQKIDDKVGNLRSKLESSGSTSQKSGQIAPQKKQSITITNNVQQIKLLEQGRNLAQSKQVVAIKDPIVSQSVSHFPSGVSLKDDLVERVIESIKVLNQKEEEVKQQKSQTSISNIQPKLKPTSKEANVTQEQSQQLQMNQMRRRTNTLTTGERPNLLHSKALINQNSQQQQTQLKENNQPMHQQIAQLKKQVSQSNHGSKDIKTQPQSTTNQQATNQGFIGSSFIKIAQEKQNNMDSNQMIQRTAEKTEKQKIDLNDPYQYNNMQMKQTKTSVPLNNQQSKTPALSQASKDKVEQLRKAFTTNKDGQSRSTKNLINTTSSSSSYQQQISSQHNLQNVSTKVSFSNQQIKSVSTNSSQITTPVGSVSQKQSSTNLPIKSDKLTKRADISLVNETTPSGNVSQNTSLSIITGTPNKTSITNMKKSTQITPQNKLNSPSQNQSHSNISSQTGSSTNLPTAMQNNLHLKRNSQQTPILNSGQGTTTILTSTQTTTIPTHIQKGKNRRQPTQTQFDSSSSNLIKNDQASKKDTVKKQFELVERVEGQKLDTNTSKPRTLLDDYFHGSPPELRNPANNPNSKGSQNNSKKQISLSKHKDKSQAYSELDQDLAEVEREFLERPKQLNFQPTQEPSINWNASPEKRMPEKKLFQDKSLVDNLNKPIDAPRSHRDEFQHREDKFIKLAQQKGFSQDDDQLYLQAQAHHQNRPPTRILIQQRSPKDDDHLHQQRKTSDNSDENQNHIEKRLNKLMEQTRRRLINQDHDEDDQDLDQSESQHLTEEHYQDYSHQQMTEALGRLEETNNSMNRMRNKAQTPQLHSQQHFTGGNPPQQIQYQLQHAPQPYPYEPHQQQHFPQPHLPYMYGQQYPPNAYTGPQIIYPPTTQGGGIQQPSHQPMITIINPAMQYQQHHPYTMFGNGGGLANINIPPHDISQYHTQNNNPNDASTNGGLMTVSGNSPTLIPTQQQRPLKQGHMNTSMIIGTDSQFFYPPPPSNQNQNTSSQDNTLLNEDDSAFQLPPKQLSQVVIPQNQLIYQQPMYQHIPQPLPHQVQQQQQQQQYYIVGYPPQGQIYQQPPLPTQGYMQANYIPPHMRQASDSFHQQQQQQQQQQQILIGNYSTISFENINPQISARGSPNTHHLGAMKNEMSVVSETGSLGNSAEKKKQNYNQEQQQKMNNSTTRIEEL